MEKMQKSNLIGVGTYGCIYRPPLKCKYLKRLNKKHEKDVMKVMDVRYFNNLLEEEISSLVREIDENQVYFIPLSEDKCIIDNNDKNLKDCHLYETDNINSTFRGVFLDYGGLNLYNYLTHNSINVYTVWKWIVHLSEAIELLQRNGIVHLDIKLANIVIKNDGYIENPRIIDFGLSAFAEEFDLQYVPSYYQYYPLFFNVLSTKESKILYQDYEKSAKIYIPNYIRGSSTDIIIKYFKASRLREKYFTNVIKSDNFSFERRQTFFNSNAGIFKVDVYMLFNMFKYGILPYTRKTNELTDNLQIDLLSTINDLIYRACHINVQQQATIYQIRSEISSVTQYY